MWDETITKEMTALERLSLLQLSPPKIKFDKKDGWKYASMHIIFDVKQQDLRHKARIVVGGLVVDSKENTTYLSTIQICVCETNAIYSCE